LTSPGYELLLDELEATWTNRGQKVPSETDLYFPVGDARYEAAFIPHVQLLPIPSLWGHPAGAGASPDDAKFLNDHIADFLKENSAKK